MTNDNNILAMAAQRTPECLSTEQLEQVLSEKAPAGARRHTEECPHCRTELALLREFFAAEPTPAEASDMRQVADRLAAHPAWREGTGQKSTWWKALFTRPTAGLVLAGLAAALTIGIWVQNPMPTQVAPITEGAVRATSIEGVEPAGDLAQAPTELHWRAVTGAAAYRVNLLDVEQASIWQTRTESPAVAIPAEARLLMTNLKTLFWQVEALDAGGKRLTVSLPQKFRVVAEQK